MSRLRLDYYSDYDEELTHAQRLEESQKFVDDMDEVIRDLEDLKEINETLVGTLGSQGLIIKDIENNTQFTGDQLDEATVELKQAEVYQHQYNVKKGLLLTTGILALTFPIGIIIGIKAGIAAGLIGIGSGAGAWYLKSK